MRYFTLCLAFILLSSTTIKAGTTDEKKKVAENFLAYLLKGDKEKCWELFDHQNVPTVNRMQLDEFIDRTRADLSSFDSFVLTMQGIKMAQDKKLDLYTFRATSTTKNITDEMLIDICFYETSNLIARIEPKMRIKENTASTTGGNETPLQNDTSLVVDNETYNVTGINIVHLSDNRGLLAIQISTIIPNDASQLEAWGKKEGAKFAHYLYTAGFIKRAKAKCKEIDRHLMDEIGVSFLDKARAGGINVMFKPNEYK